MTRVVDEVDATVGAKLRRLRTQRGLSLEAVGRVIGTAYQQVQKYELGRNRLSARNLYLFARFFEVEIADFFDGLEVAAPGPEVASVAAQLERIARDRPEVARELCALVVALAPADKLNPP